MVTPKIVWFIPRFIFHTLCLLAQKFVHGCPFECVTSMGLHPSKIPLEFNSLVLPVLFNVSMGLWRAFQLQALWGFRIKGRILNPAGN